MQRRKSGYANFSYHAVFEKREKVNISVDDMFTDYFNDLSLILLTSFPLPLLRIR